MKEIVDLCAAGDWRSAPQAANEALMPLMKGPVRDVEPHPRERGAQALGLPRWEACACRSWTRRPSSPSVSRSIMREVGVLGRCKDGAEADGARSASPRGRRRKKSRRAGARAIGAPCRRTVAMRARRRQKADASTRSRAHPGSASMHARIAQDRKDKVLYGTAEATTRSERHPETHVPNGRGGPATSAGSGAARGVATRRRARTSMCSSSTSGPSSRRRGAGPAAAGRGRQQNGQTPRASSRRRRRRTRTPRSRSSRSAASMPSART